ncbi:hypothetical protein SAMD00019534_067260 [Acytostelium subglobosum LB1]|uniref:hypothetical protein n=1 Tax=Acytostelium subglobosum LB1 TaxID=1410327 RepID=UPI000644E0E8|nr:hypothetical protein SAMD00019534_067260 [Acytostelium subglobosum LB1]GAM23551.1 hypothetical protein SAMD00019534_067260 [Acytostelium subglobosum LB1]|eukprot:XP_012753292.1 hypothetical protein SAMD00019534_067260 [Acytostelium subglobosum LB1]
MSNQSTTQTGGGGGAHTGGPTQPKPAHTLRGIVRAVNSGDSLVIQEIDSARGEFKDKQEFLLSGICAPRLARPGNNDKAATQDDPFAWDSRDFLRKLCIGKRVNFVIDYTNPASRKSNITAYVSDDSENSINKQMVENGWATVYKSKKPDAALMQLELESTNRQLGLHNKSAIAVNNAVRPTHNITSFDLFNKLKGKQLQAFVENIRSTKYKLVILPSFHVVTVQLSGVQCPGYKKDASTGEMVPEPFAVDAETLVNNNVLHRDITLTLDTLDKQGNLFGSVMCAGKDVAEELLRQGLGSFVAWSATNRTIAEQAALKTAEQNARNSRQRIWSLPGAVPAAGAETSTTSTSSTGVSAPTQAEGHPQEISGKVTEIGNSGQLTIVDEHRGEHKIALASIRVPGYSKVTSESESDERRFERYWAVEAKEWLRKRLIGQKVNAKLDFIRPALPANNLPEKAFYSVYFGKGNVSLGLLEAGLAQVQEHKSSDNRSVEYDALVMAENKAKKKAVGLFASHKSTPNFTVNDVSAADDKNLKAKATKLLPHIRGTLNPAIVEYVFSAQRFKLYVPKESCLINFSLSSIRSPKRGENAELDLLSNQALLFSREHLHQHDVFIRIDDVDKGGNFIGTLMFNNKNYALTLVEQGYASIYDPMSRLDKTFVDAETKAKNARLNIWKSYDPEAEQRELAAAEAAEAEKRAVRTDAQEITISSVASATELYVRRNNNDIEESLRALDLDDASTANWSPKVGEMVRAKYSQDQKWYRAKVLAITGKEVDILFHDYGNKDIVSLGDVKPLSGKFQVLPALSNIVSLAYLKASSNEYRNDDAIDYLEGVVGNIMTLTVQSRDDSGKTSVVLKDEQGVLNCELLRKGLLKLDHQTAKRNPAVYDKYSNEEKLAKKERLCIWEHGDVSSDDEDEAAKKFAGKPQRGGRR